MTLGPAGIFVVTDASDLSTAQLQHVAGVGRIT